MNLRRSDRITFVGSAVVVFLYANAVAQEGHYGLGHDKWHESFYSTLKRNDGGLCCNLMDCRPTQSRMIGDHYEVKVDGAWMPVFRVTRSIMSSRRMEVLMSALPNKKA